MPVTSRSLALESPRCPARRRATRKSVGGAKRPAAPPARPSRRLLRFRMASRRDAVAPTVERILRAATGAGLSAEQRDNLAVACAEALSNAAVHGHRLESHRPVRVVVIVEPPVVCGGRGDGFGTRVRRDAPERSDRPRAPAHAGWPRRVPDAPPGGRCGVQPAGQPRPADRPPPAAAWEAPGPTLIRGANSCILACFVRPETGGPVGRWRDQEVWMRVSGWPWTFVVLAFLTATGCGSATPVAPAPQPTPAPSLTPPPVPEPTPTPTPAPSPSTAPEIVRRL